MYPIAIPGCSGQGKVFVGQRQDPFFLDLGGTFDLVNYHYPAEELVPAGMSTRNFGATPRARKSFSASDTNCIGLNFVVCVPVSDIPVTPRYR